MWIKVCGITRLEDAVSAARFGADAVGFVFDGGDRSISPDEARDIARRMPAGPAKVGVFSGASASEVARTAEYCGLDLVQLRGGEDEEYCRELGDMVIKTVEVEDTLDVIRARRYPCRALVLDGYGCASMDWKRVRALKPGHPVIISGELNPGNVGRAVKEVAPYGVDVCAGVESEPGVKDPVLMYRFIEKARKADYDLHE